MSNSGTHSLSAESFLPTSAIGEFYRIRSKCDTFGADHHVEPLRRNMTCATMFVDISGFTKLSEAMAQFGTDGLARLSHHLNSYFALVAKILAAHGGDLIKFAGDAAIVIWPIAVDGHEPEPHRTRDAVRAAGQAALDMQTELHKAQLDEGVTLSVKIGIGLGPVALCIVGGVSGRWEAFVTGPAVQASFEAQAQADAGGQTWLTRKAWQAMHGDMDGQPAAQQEYGVADNSTFQHRLEQAFGLHSGGRERGAETTHAAQPYTPLVKHHGGQHSYVVTPDQTLYFKVYKLHGADGRAVAHPAVDVEEGAKLKPRRGSGTGTGTATADTAPTGRSDWCQLPSQAAFVCISSDGVGLCLRPAAKVSGARSTRAHGHGHRHRHADGQAHGQVHSPQLEGREPSGPSFGPARHNSMLSRLPSMAAMRHLSSAMGIGVLAGAPQQYGHYRAMGALAPGPQHHHGRHTTSSRPAQALGQTSRVPGRLPAKLLELFSPGRSVAGQGHSPALASGSGSGALSPGGHGVDGGLSTVGPFSPTDGFQVAGFRANVASHGRGARSSMLMTTGPGSKASRLFGQGPYVTTADRGHIVSHASAAGVTSFAPRDGAFITSRPMLAVAAAAGTHEEDEGDEDQDVHGHGVAAAKAAAVHEDVPRIVDTESMLPSLLPGALVSWIQAGQAGHWARLEHASSHVRPVAVMFASLGIPDNVMLAATHDGPALCTVHEVMRQAQAAIDTHGGTLNKFLWDDKGSTLLAVFGAPPDHPGEGLGYEDRACAGHRDNCGCPSSTSLAPSARAILSGLSLLSRVAAKGYQASVGIAYGHVYCGLVGGNSRREYSVLGDAVNTAARLMSKAGHIELITATTTTPGFVVKPGAQALAESGSHSTVSLESYHGVPAGVSSAELPALPTAPAQANATPAAPASPALLSVWSKARGSATGEEPVHHAEWPGRPVAVALLIDGHAAAAARAAGLQLEELPTLTVKGKAIPLAVATPAWVGRLAKMTDLAVPVSATSAGQSTAEVPAGAGSSLASTGCSADSGMPEHVLNYQMTLLDSQMADSMSTGTREVVALAQQDGGVGAALPAHQGTVSQTSPSRAASDGLWLADSLVLSGTAAARAAGVGKGKAGQLKARVRTKLRLPVATSVFAASRRARAHNKVRLPAGARGYLSLDAGHDRWARLHHMIAKRLPRMPLSVPIRLKGLRLPGQHHSSGGAYRPVVDAVPAAKPHTGSQPEGQSRGTTDNGQPPSQPPLTGNVSPHAVVVSSVSGRHGQLHWSHTVLKPKPHAKKPQHINAVAGPTSALVGPLDSVASTAVTSPAGAGLTRPVVREACGKAVGPGGTDSAAGITASAASTAVDPASPFNRAALVMQAAGDCAATEHRPGLLKQSSSRWSEDDDFEHDAEASADDGQHLAQLPATSSAANGRASFDDGWSTDDGEGEHVDPVRPGAAPEVGARVSKYPAERWDGDVTMVLDTADATGIAGIMHAKQLDNDEGDEDIERACFMPTAARAVGHGKDGGAAAHIQGIATAHTAEHGSHQAHVIEHTLTGAASVLVSAAPQKDGRTRRRLSHLGQRLRPLPAAASAVAASPSNIIAALPTHVALQHAEMSLAVQAVAAAWAQWPLASASAPWAHLSCGILPAARPSRWLSYDTAAIAVRQAVQQVLWPITSIVQQQHHITLTVAVSPSLTAFLLSVSGGLGDRWAMMEMLLCLVGKGLVSVTGPAELGQHMSALERTGVRTASARAAAGQATDQLHVHNGAGHAAVLLSAPVRTVTVHWGSTSGLTGSHHVHGRAREGQQAVAAGSDAGGPATDGPQYTSPLPRLAASLHLPLADLHWTAVLDSLPPLMQLVARAVASVSMAVVQLRALGTGGDHETHKGQLHTAHPLDLPPLTVDNVMMALPALGLVADRAQGQGAAVVQGPDSHAGDGLYHGVHFYLPDIIPGLHHEPSTGHGHADHSNANQQDLRSLLVHALVRCEHAGLVFCGYRPCSDSTTRGGSGDETSSDDRIVRMAAWPQMLTLCARTLLEHRVAVFKRVQDGRGRAVHNGQDHSAVGLAVLQHGHPFIGAIPRSFHGSSFHVLHSGWLLVRKRPFTRWTAARLLGPPALALAQPQWKRRYAVLTDSMVIAPDMPGQPALLLFTSDHHAATSRGRPREVLLLGDVEQSQRPEPTTEGPAVVGSPTLVTYNPGTAHFSIRAASYVKRGRLHVGPREALVRVSAVPGSAHTQVRNMAGAWVEALRGVAEAMNHTTPRSSPTRMVSDALVAGVHPCPMPRAHVLPDLVLTRSRATHISELGASSHATEGVKPVDSSGMAAKSRLPVTARVVRVATVGSQQPAEASQLCQWDATTLTRHVRSSTSDTMHVIRLPDASSCSAGAGHTAVVAVSTPPAAPATAAAGSAQSPGAEAADRLPQSGIKDSLVAFKLTMRTGLCADAPPAHDQGVASRARPRHEVSSTPDQLLRTSGLSNSADTHDLESISSTFSFLSSTPDHSTATNSTAPNSGPSHTFNGAGPSMPLRGVQAQAQAQARRRGSQDKVMQQPGGVQSVGPIVGLQSFEMSVGLAPCPCIAGATHAGQASPRGRYGWTASHSRVRSYLPMAVGVPSGTQVAVSASSSAVPTIPGRGLPAPIAPWPAWVVLELSCSRPETQRRPSNTTAATPIPASARAASPMAPPASVHSATPSAPAAPVVVPGSVAARLKALQAKMTSSGQGAPAAGGAHGTVKPAAGATMSGQHTMFGSTVTGPGGLLGSPVLARLGGTWIGKQLHRVGSNAGFRTAGTGGIRPGTTTSLGQRASAVGDNRKPVTVTGSGQATGAATATDPSASIAPGRTRRLSEQFERMSMQWTGMGSTMAAGHGARRDRDHDHGGDTAHTEAPLGGTAGRLPATHGGTKAGTAGHARMVARAEAFEEAW